MADDRSVLASARQKQWEERQDNRDLLYFAALCAVVAYGFRVFGAKRISTFEVIFTAFGVALGAALLAFLAGMGLHFARQRGDARWLISGAYFMFAAVVFLNMGGPQLARFAMSLFY